jgi:hypothetical protein
MRNNAPENKDVPYMSNATVASEVNMYEIARNVKDFFLKTSLLGSCSAQGVNSLLAACIRVQGALSFEMNWTRRVECNCASDVYT